MNFGAWLLWGFVGTAVLTSLEIASQGLGLSRISLPYILGSMVTDNRDRAKRIGFIVHLLNGWVFSLLYVLIFQSLGRATWLIGAVIGLSQALFVLTAGMWLLPSIHPRMASEQQGPTVKRQLEPPGFFALNYGVQTPLSVLVAHTVFGVILGAFYSFPS